VTAPRDVYADGLFPVCVATHDLGLLRLFDLATVLLLLGCRPGDRVLDLGAGAGFSSEMLARLGYTVVAADPDLRALAANRRRPTFDASRIAGRVEVIATVAERLPFSDAAFDGLVGLNVLHHVPDLTAVTHEVARVLKPGAHAVFCEPGLEHLEKAETQRAIREHGETDQPFDVLAFLREARGCGFSSANLSATLISPLRLLPVEEIELFASGQHPRPHLREAGVLQELHRCRAYAMLVREGAREKTSRYPGALRAEIDVRGLPRELHRGCVYQAVARVTNTGDTRWLAKPSDLGGFVTMGCKLVRSDGRLVTDALGRTCFGSDVPPDTSAEITMALGVPEDLEPGEYELRFDVVNELVCWFSDLPGNAAHARRVHVDP
jgi:SAM-dependent methyltransferase